MRRSILKPSIATPPEYWEKVAIENPCDAICTGYDEQKFNTSKDTIVFLVNIPWKANYTVLDLGCGIGRTAKFVAPNVKKYVGVDYSKNMIVVAKERNKQLVNAEFYVNDGSTLEILESNLFDIAYCELVFLHVKKSVTMSYVNEVHRVLKPSGIFYAQLPKLEFYHDKSVAFRKDEVNKMFTVFSNVQYMEFESKPNWYYVTAIK